MVGTERSGVPGILSDGDLMGPGLPQELLVLLAAHEGHDAGAGEPGQTAPRSGPPLRRPRSRVCCARAGCRPSLELTAQSDPRPAAWPPVRTARSPAAPLESSSARRR